MILKLTMGGMMTIVVWLFMGSVPQAKTYHEKYHGSVGLLIKQRAAEKCILFHGDFIDP